MKDLKLIKILYVEDGKFASKVGLAVLRRISDHVYAESNGLDALKRFNEIKPDIVITDLDMPRMGGYELISRIRLTDRTTPVIILSAMDWTDPINLNVLPKPISLSKIKTLIQKLLSGGAEIDIEAEKNLYKMGRSRALS